MVIKLRLGNPHMRKKNCVLVNSMYTTRENPGQKPGLVRMAGHCRGTWRLHKVSVTVLAV